MANLDSTARPSDALGLDRLQQTNQDFTPFSPVRIACTYFIAGLLWIFVTDVLLASSGGLTSNGLFVAIGKGMTFVALSTLLVFWLTIREYRQVRRATSLLRAVVEGTPDAIFVKAIDGRYLLANAAAAKYLGRTVEEVTGRYDRELLSPSDSEKLIQFDQTVMASGKAGTLEETFTVDGTTLTFHATKAPFFDSDGQVIGLLGISRDVTDRRKVESEFRETEARLREAQRIARLGSWSWEPATDRVWWSDAEFELFGVAPGAVPPGLESFLAFLHPDDRAIAVERVHAMKSGANQFANDLRVNRADGTLMWIHSQARATRDDQGKLLRVEGTDQDISVQRLAAQMAKNSELRLHAAVELAGLGIIEVDYDTETADLSHRAAEQFGFSSAGKVQRSEVHARFHPADAARLQPLIESALDPSGTGTFAAEHRIVRPDGTERWLNVRKQVTFVGGKPRHAVLVTADVTEQRLAAVRLQEQELLVREAAELAKVGGWGIDPVTLRSDWTPAVAQMYGLAFDAAPPVDDAFKFFSEEQRPVLQAAIAAALQDGIPHDMELELHGSDGQKRWVRTICRPMVKNGEVVRVRGSLQDITDRKRAEAELRASERRLRLALEAAGAVAYTWDITNDTVSRYYSTEPALPVTNASLDTLNNVRQRVHPDDVQAFDERLADCLSAGTEYRNEYRVVRPDGSIAWLEDYGFVNRAADGTPLSLTGLCMDVSRRIETTEALRTSEAKYRQLVDMLPTAIFVHAERKILYGNNAFLRLFGAKSSDDLLNLNPFDLVHSSSHELLRERQSEMARTHAAVAGCDMLGVRLDGRLVPVHVVASPVDGYGNRATLVALTDLTERERAAALLRSVLDSVDDAILTIDSEGVVTSANRATERLFGSSLNEIVGKSVGLLIGHPAGQPLSEFIAAFLEPLSTRAVEVGRDVEGLRRDGSGFPAELTVTEFVLDREREFTAVVRDLTTRRQLEEQFRQAQKMEAVGQLAGGVAHDFNNLLMVINGESGLLLMRSSAEDPIRPSLIAIHDAGERAARLTQQLLSFSRKSLVIPRLVNLNELTIGSGKMLRRLISEEISISIVTNPKPFFVEVDPGQLEQVLMNLAVNARDAMPTGGTLTIETGTVALESPRNPMQASLPPGRYGFLRVADTGVGMSAEVKERIFEPFFTTKGVGVGTGLGLAVVHGIVQQSGGAVSVDSTPGAGTTFIVYLPLAADAENEPATGEADDTPGGHEVILVVEDEDSVRRFVRAALEDAGYVVHAAGDGQEAQSILKQIGHVNLLVTDVIMPRMSGRELAETLRTELAGLRVLYMSGYTDDALDRHGLQATEQYIQKPFSHRQLTRRVREILDQD
ncbi:MAG: PAS domain S-box protein [Pirellulales bacterium]